MKRNKKIVASVLAVLLAFVAVGGTIAWLTSQSQLTNSFTVGGITSPEEKPDPSDPDNPGGGDFDDDDESNGKLDGNLYESKWEQYSPLIPGTDVDKNPNVGIGPKSEDAYVFLFVKNNTVREGVENAVTPFFNLSANWYGVSALDGSHTYGPVVSSAVEAGTQSYTSGLFMYSTDGNNPTVLTAYDDKDAWTGEAFSKVITPAATELDDFVEVSEVEGTYPEMEVYCFIYAANEDQTNAGDAIDAARNWAAKLSGDITE